MGVPALFRWLDRKYPRITTRVVELESQIISENGEMVDVPIDTSLPNPNLKEFDNLYLDMNGIIHPCCHPENKPAPETEDDMMIEIFKYIDRIFAMVRPRKLLFMAIDGVAPRAKINQQRSRRFRAAKEAKDKAETEAKVREEMESKGLLPPSTPNKKKPFDSNVITPGTRFMLDLAICLRYYIAERLTTDPGWKNVKIILSDASVPGEGEHKIMDFIRRQRMDPAYPANTSHVLYGLDADLIMLALATHEPYFYILREDVFWNEGKGCSICAKSDHQAKDCQQLALRATQQNAPSVPRRPYIFLSVAILREYLELELKIHPFPAFPYDFERLIDDWVFLLFFVGNDFLPHLPSLEIREGAIDLLVSIYKRVLPRMGGYLTHDGDLHIDRLQVLVSELGKEEDAIFQRRRQREQRDAENQHRNNNNNKNNNNKNNHHEGWTQRQMSLQDNSVVQPLPSPPKPMGRMQQMRMQLEADIHVKDYAGHVIPIAEGNVKRRKGDTSEPKEESVNRKEESATEDSNESTQKQQPTTTIPQNGHSLPSPLPPSPPSAPSSSLPVDPVRMYEPGWKSRYYQNKFPMSNTLPTVISSVVTAYIEGLCWVLRYYYQGVPSWHWYYPYHYPPFASDLTPLPAATHALRFELGAPFRPLDQLMGVLPAASGDHVPAPLRALMVSPDSPILDYYPETFEIDLNGKKQSWQGVALLPFIDEQRLLSAIDAVDAQLTSEDRERNRRGDALLFVHQQHTVGALLRTLYEGERGQLIMARDGLVGDLTVDTLGCLPEMPLIPPMEGKGLAMIAHTSVSAGFIPVEEEEGNVARVFPAQLLSTVTLPPRQLTLQDMTEFIQRNRSADTPDNRNLMASLNIKQGFYGERQQVPVSFNGGGSHREQRWEPREPRFRHGEMDHGRAYEGRREDRERSWYPPPPQRGGHSGYHGNERDRRPYADRSGYVPMHLPPVRRQGEGDERDRRERFYR